MVFDVNVLILEVANNKFYLELLYDFLQELTPEDIGTEVFGPYRLCFEGFNQTCWNDYEEKKSKRLINNISELEQIIITEWKERYQVNNIVESNWIKNGEEFQDDIFFTIFRNI